MARKNRLSRRQSSPSALRRKLDSQAEAFLASYQRRDFASARLAADTLTRDFPGVAFSWKALGTCLLESGDAAQALPALERALEIKPEDVEALANLGKALQTLGRYEDAKHYLQCALEFEPDNHQANLNIAHVYSQQDDRREAIAHLDKSIEATPTNFLPRMRKATALVEERNYDAALDILEPLAQAHPRNPGVQSNLANLYSTMGRFDEAEHHYWEAVEMARGNPLPYSNYYFTAHYNPRHDAAAFFEMAEDWRQRYSPARRPARPITPREADRSLRVGLVSSGLRVHPVGQMITVALERIGSEHLEFVAYSDKLANDVLARRIQNTVADWRDVGHLSHGQLAEQIREDEIDILIDMTGHTSGNRLMAMAQEPAPLIVKWVGGLFNTVGLDAFDYLISDSIETPPGVDGLYFEKLIRLPDDYICYMPTRDAPSAPGPLPALGNGYITLGCFNNPAKLNEPLLREWASLLHQLPKSRLFLKGGQFTNEAYRESIHRTLEKAGIERERILLEGPSSHAELMRAYQRVDIALDSWPYSGGLTTCESLLMGVPVVTLPGPSFAGRHSATHLINAGLPELVADSWDEYRQRVVELAGDLDSLALIRQGLRQQLLDSPVCDAPRFARHLLKALRAIWQRRCEEKPPAALTFNKEGEARFEGEAQPVAIDIPETATASPAANAKSGEAFHWQLPGKIVVIDNSAKLVREQDFERLIGLDAFGVVAFDPASRVAEASRFEGSGDVQLFPHAVLGDGRPATLHACLDPAMSSTLRPLPVEQLDDSQRQGSRVLTELPINTITLDSIEGLESLDWLILDDLSDAVAILENGEEALQDTLLVQVRIAFQPTHECQPNFAEVSHWMVRHGFRFYRFNDMAHKSHLPESVLFSQRQASDLMGADAIFIPSHARIADIGKKGRVKLAFLLHAIFGIKDMAHLLLSSVDEGKAQQYLVAEGLVQPLAEEEAGEEAEAGAEEENKESSGDAHEESGFTVPQAPFMSSAERDLFRKSLFRAKHYFEFGSGGSTVWAVEQGLTAYGVESDANWVNALKAKLGDGCQVKVVDIGPTREWGYPVSLDHSERFPDYSRAIHSHDMAFDLILVDGRFRVACALSAVKHLLKHHPDPTEARIFIHDFWDRPPYHAVLEFLEPLESVETAGLFRLKEDIDKQRLDQVWKVFSRQPA
ncbi:tetratricopeptide repeat protein [Halomonas sp. 11-S5]|uniref:O-linked N-acetylglucosamine transferase family protein n=1 Tax=Halomonas sp. 11-S5 TaxID=2994064 RepID=UPI002469AE05|nr:tetratricopeptide repeat protein [Halomonas sp. 11-S5]